MPARIVVLASGSGTTLQAILDDPTLRPHVVAAGTDVPDCAAMARATAAGIDTFAVALREHPDRAAWNDALADEIAKREPDLVVLAGFMRILGPHGRAPVPHREHPPGAAAGVPGRARDPRRTRRRRAVPPASPCTGWTRASTPDR